MAQRPVSRVLAVVTCVAALGAPTVAAHTATTVWSLAPAAGRAANQVGSTVQVDGIRWLGRDAPDATTLLGLAFAGPEIRPLSIVSATLTITALRGRGPVAGEVRAELNPVPLPFGPAANIASRPTFAAASSISAPSWPRGAMQRFDVTNAVRAAFAQGPRSSLALIAAASGAAAGRHTFMTTGAAAPTLTVVFDEDHGLPPVQPAGWSRAMGRWTPTAPHDTCTKVLHDSYSVIGPDGKRYPTWHPPVVVDPATGRTCTFGHEHGRDPKRSQLWKTRQVQRHFYFDANGNGVMDPAEEAVTGVPFGYAAEQLEAYAVATGRKVMRHEDHVGHKIDWANGEPDIATHGMSSAPDGGVWIGRLGNGVVAADTGMRCYFLGKPHQGTSTPDAFTHHVHEVLYFADCRHVTDLARCANPSDLSTCPDAHPMNSRLSVSVMQPFGRGGGFTRFMPMCGVERRGDPRDFVNLGVDPLMSDLPDGPGDREIITRDCIETGFLVPQGQWSGNLYEAWPASLALRRADGTPIVSGINLLFDVEDAARYFYPEATKALRGYSTQRPELAGTNLGYAMDLCYDVSLASQGRRYRGGPCDWAMNYGAITGIGWNDPRSAFRGLHRGMYFQPGTLAHGGGTEVFYTDPFGGNATSTPFAGAIRQQVTPKTLGYSSLIGGAPIDPRVVDRQHDDGGGSVHAPN